MSQPQLLQITGNLGAAVGIAVDEQKNRLFFVEYVAGKLKQISIPPVCGLGTSIPSCSTTISTIAPGLVHPEDVQVDLNQGCAYVTTRDDPGTTGKLWKINLSNGLKTLVAYNLGGPQQLFLDTSQNQAYTVGYNDGRLRLVDLMTGAKKPIITSLHSPVGLVVTHDRRYAYVAEQGPPATISKIDLSTGKRASPYVIRDGVGGISLVAPFFLAWSDDSQNSLYIAERDPANIVSRLNLITLQKSTVGANLPWPFRPTGIAINNTSSPKYLYVTTNTEIVRVELNSWDLQNLPVFLGVGHVPWSRISSDGYADTHLDVGQPFQVTDAPFGGTLDVFGNLTNFFKTLKATHYEILMSKDGGQFLPINVAWNTYHWNTSTSGYDLVPIAPEPNTTRYKIPKETFDQDFHPELWYPPYLFLRWTSAENGFYQFKVRLYKDANLITPDPLPVNLNILPLKIDNTPQNVKIESIWQKVPPDTQIYPCDIVSTGANQFYFNITANDPNSHLLNWSLVALWGDNLSKAVDSDDYLKHYSPPSRLWAGISNTNVPIPPPNYWSADANCAHTFYLGAWKRTIDGYNYILYRDYHKSITINNLPKLIVTPIPVHPLPP